MANDVVVVKPVNNNDADHEESSPLLAKNLAGEKPSKVGAAAEEPTQAWTMNRLLVCHGSMVGEPIRGRVQWNSSLFACLGRHDDFCSRDLKVCLLGSVAPCVLYGSNVERLESAPGTFATHCLPYTGLYLIGNYFFGGNSLAPCFSYPSPIAV